MFKLMLKVNQKGVAHLLLPIILILGLIAAVYLITSGNPLKLFSKASNAAIVFKKPDGSALPEQNGVPYSIYPRVKIEFTSPLGGPATGGNLNLTDFKKAYNSKKGDARYNPSYDLNNDGAVNITDFSFTVQAGRKLHLFMGGVVQVMALAIILM